MWTVFHLGLQPSEDNRFDKNFQNCTIMLNLQAPLSSKRHCPGPVRDKNGSAPRFWTMTYVPSFKLQGYAFSFFKFWEGEKAARAIRNCCVRIDTMVTEANARHHASMQHHASCFTTAPLGTKFIGWFNDFNFALNKYSICQNRPRIDPQFSTMTAPLQLSGVGLASINTVRIRLGYMEERKRCGTC